MAYTITLEASKDGNIACIDNVLDSIEKRMVYITNDGEVVCNHLSPKAMLDKMRYICKGKSGPIAELYRQFNKETRDGKNMTTLSKLLGEAIASIIEVKEESDINSLFKPGGTSVLTSEIKGLDDFELVSFLVVKYCSFYKSSDLTVKKVLID